MSALAIKRELVEVPYETTFWGQKCPCDPRFVEAALGDGAVLLGITPLATRPNYYLIRIDSSWHLQGCRICEDRCPDELVEHLDEIYEAIEDEYGDAERIRESNEELEKGEQPDPADWPVFNDSCGTSWWQEDPKPYMEEQPA